MVSGPATTATLARIRAERPSTAGSVAAILSDFLTPTDGVAKSGNFGGDRFCDALADAGWDLRFLPDADLWDARHPGTGEMLHYVEGDVYLGPWPDPASARYARDYNNGWRTARRNNVRLSFGVPVDRAGQRNVSRAWRDGFYDQAADELKWTWRQARLGGWDDVGDYLFAESCVQGWAREISGLSSHDSERQQAMDALSAFRAAPSEANCDALGEAVAAMREASQPGRGDLEPDDELVVVDGEVWPDAASWPQSPATQAETQSAEMTDVPIEPSATRLNPVSQPAPEVGQAPSSAETAAFQAGLSARPSAFGFVEGPLRKPPPGTSTRPHGPAGGPDTRPAKGL